MLSSKYGEDVSWKRYEHCHEDEVGRLLTAWRNGKSKAKIAMVTIITGTTGVSKEAEVRTTAIALTT